MKKDYQDKMVRTGDESTKQLGERVPAGEKRDPKAGAPIPFEGQSEKQLFYFPQYGRSVEATSQEEAEEKLKEELKHK